MKPRPLLFTAAPEALGGNGPSATVIDFPAASAASAVAAPAVEAPAAAATPAAAAPEAPAAEAKPPGLLERISASIQSKGALLATGEAYRLRAETAEASLGTATAELTTLRAAHAALLKERGEIATLLDTAVAEKQEVDTAAASQVAALGFEPAALPAASAAPEETKAELLARLEKEPDNNKRYALAARINEMN